LIVLDTSFLYALLDARDARHRQATTWYEHLDEELSTTPLVVAELDHLAGARAGRAAQKAARADLAEAAYEVEWWGSAAAEAVEVAERYGDLGVSLTDGSLVALGARLGTARVATFDERHFRAMTPISGAEAFVLLPVDAGSE
jgi:predicted nucleic acid-binding protein